MTCSKYRTLPNGCLLSKSDFVTAINKLKAADELQNEIRDLMNKVKENIDDDFMNAAGLMINHETLVIKLLEILMNDKYGNISYYIYELNYGREYTPGCIIDTFNRKEIDISTPELLYDYLIREGFYEDNT